MSIPKPPKPAKASDVGSGTDVKIKSSLPELAEDRGEFCKAFQPVEISPEYGVGEAGPTGFTNARAPI